MSSTHSLPGIETDIVDAGVYRRAVSRFRASPRPLLLPTFAQLADPASIPAELRARLAAVDPDAPDPLNLLRVHWFNDESRRRLAPLPAHVVLPPSLTGVPAQIVVLLGRTFPMIHAHKVLAAYACLAPRLVTGRFDPTRDRAIWPSTGNYCRGGVAISRIMGCRGVAVLPEGMSRERFEWLDRWVADPADIVRTPGCESNVKEIYDACKQLAAQPETVVFNQFSEYANYLVHRLCTGRAVERVFQAMLTRDPSLRPRAFVSATGSAGTIAAGDHLKRALREPSDGRFAIAAVEAVECPTLLANGFGEHNIQGIGDKHVPLIHNVMNTDFVVGVSDRASDSLDVLFNSERGREYLTGRRHVPKDIVAALPSFGFSGIANVVASIKLARYLKLEREDVILTVATDAASMYDSSRERFLSDPAGLGRPLDAVTAAEIGGQHLLGIATDHVMELGRRERERIFNLGYYTWVEQQGVSVEDFEARRAQRFWDGLTRQIPRWDALIEAFNRETGALSTSVKASAS